jgi:hypothetical protein
MTQLTTQGGIMVVGLPKLDISLAGYSMTASVRPSLPVCPRVYLFPSSSYTEVPIWNACPASLKFWLQQQSWVTFVLSLNYSTLLPVGG